MSTFRTRAGRLAGLWLALLLLGAACAPQSSNDTTDNPDDGGAAALAGEVVISGSSTVEPISALVAEKFQSVNPDVSISVDGPGTGDGFELFCNGETDISDASRSIDIEEEVPLCEENGVEFIELKVAIDGLSIITSPENGIDCVSFGDLYALTGPESKGFKSWADANELAKKVGGVAAPFPDDELVITGPGEESGTYDYYLEAVIEPIAEERKLPEDEWVARPDYQASGNDNVIIEGVAGSPTSLGWVGYAYYVQNQAVVKALQVDGGEGCIAPTPETIADTTYPISRFLYIYVNKAKAEENPALAGYVDYYLSGDGLASVSEVSYVDLHTEDLEQSKSVWEAREIGTRES